MIDHTLDVRSAVMLADNKAMLEIDKMWPQNRKVERERDARRIFVEELLAYLSPTGKISE
jgi:hypothetical protein